MEMSFHRQNSHARGPKIFFLDKFLIRELISCGTFAKIPRNVKNRIVWVKGGKCMPANKIVVHDKGGNIFKGTTADFLPKRPLFHLSLGGIHGEEVKKIFVNHLKAVFFVRDFRGNRDYKEIRDLVDRPGSGKKIKAVFKDGEIVSGHTHSINMDQQGFFLVPVDPKSNNERIFIIFSSLNRLEVEGSQINLAQ
jgi:hypothetical protein